VKIKLDRRVTPAAAAHWQIQISQVESLLEEEPRRVPFAELLELLPPRGVQGSAQNRLRGCLQMALTRAGFTLERRER